MKTILSVRYATTYFYSFIIIFLQKSNSAIITNFTKNVIQTDVK